MMSIAQKDLLKEKLDQLQCHFTWGPQKENIDLDDMKQRLQDLMQAGVKYQAMPHNHLAFVNCLQGNCEEAIQNLKEAEKILRENHEHEFERRSIITYGNYAWVYYHMGQLTEAQSNLAKLEMICKRFTNGSRYTALIPEVYGEKGWSLLSSASQYYEEAKECFEKAQEEDLDDTDWNAGYATALFRLEGFSGTPESGEHSQSVKQLRHVLDLDTDDSVAIVLLALKLQEFNHKEEALKLVEQALQKSPDLTYVTRYAATFYRMKGDVEKAVELLKKALEITTNSTFFHHQIGQRYRKNLFQLNNNPGSKKTHNPAFQRKAELINKCKYHFEKAFEHRPLTSIQPQLDFARICSLNSEYPKPEVIYSNLLKLENIHPENKQAICLQAGLFELNHKRSESKAITHFLEGMKVKYDSIERTKCRKNLEMLAERRLCKNSRDSEAFRVLGFLHQLDGEKCEAIECFERALEFDRDNEEYRHSLCELRLSVKATLTFPTKTKHLKDALILSDL